jgi:hypothetical protein
LAARQDNLAVQPEAPGFDSSVSVAGQLSDPAAVRFVFGVGRTAEFTIWVHDQMVAGLVSANLGTRRALRHYLRWPVLDAFQ